MSTTCEIVAPFEGEAQATLEKLYAAHGVSAASADKKIIALNLAIESGESRFYAYGGDETEEMQLRALERIYLLINGVAVC